MKYGSLEYKEMVSKERKKLESKYGQVWDTGEVQEDFYIESFLAPCVTVTRKKDAIGGILHFQQSSPLYKSLPCRWG